MKTEIYDDLISIIEDDGSHVVSWSKEEWENDPGVVPSIANAIYMANSNPDELRFFISKIRKIIPEKYEQKVRRTSGVPLDY